MNNQETKTVQQVKSQARKLRLELDDIVKNYWGITVKNLIAHAPMSPRAWLRGAVLSVVGMLLATTLSAVVGPMAVASTTPIPAPELLPLGSDTSFTPNDGSKLLIEKSYALRAGESRRVYGRVEVTSNTTAPKLVEVYARCVAPDGEQSGVHATAGSNHEGYNTPASPFDPNVPNVSRSYLTKGRLQLYVSLLFQPTSAGIYRCQLLAAAEDPNVMFTAVAKKSSEEMDRYGDEDNSGDSATWLRVSRADEFRAQWWLNPECGSNGTESTCTYLGGSNGMTQVYVFYNDGSPLNWWLAASNADFADASATVGLTTCYNGTASCTDNNEGGAGGTVVTSHLEFIQLNSGLGVCKVNQSPDVTSTINKYAHHYMIQYKLQNVPINLACGSRLFLLRVLVRYVSGNPVKIDGTRPDGVTLTPYESYTNAFAINSAYGTVVPNVIGAGEALARNFIGWSDYIVGNVDYIISTAPVGTVISQNPASGTILGGGSPVNFSVSRGGMTVPSLFLLSPKEATSTLAGLTLNASVSTLQLCRAPGKVVSQSPQAGAVVALGATVNLTVDSSTSSACGGVTVPSLLSLSPKEAEALLAGLKLNASVSFVKTCLNPGKVVAQDPPAGVLVTPGSTVKITVDSGTSSTCGVSR